MITALAVETLLVSVLAWMSIQASVTLAAILTVILLPWALVRVRTVADACGDDVGDACDALAGRSLENGISAIRATSIGTTTPTATAHFVQYRMVEPWAIDSPCC